MDCEVVLKRKHVNVILVDNNFIFFRVIIHGGYHKNFYFIFNFLKKCTLSLGLVAFLNHLLNNELKICEKYEAEVI